jgi:Phosphoribosyl transferase/TRSP domain C terminus to PRTase_2
MSARLGAREAREAYPGSVAERLGIRVTVTPASPAAAPFADAVEVGLRRNPNRAQLLVSRLLGKHIPVPARGVLSAAHQLGSLVRQACEGQEPVVVGFAETATGLGHGVAAVSAPDGGPAPCRHTSRRPAPEGALVVRFFEEHSHAVDQALAVTGDADLRGGGPLVLVDDELTTGTTAMNAIRALHERWPRRRYILASLIDCRSQDRRHEVAEAVRELGADVLSVSLLDGRVDLPEGILASVRDFVAHVPSPREPAGSAGKPVSWRELTLPRGVPTTAMLGWGRDEETAAGRAMADLAGSLAVARDRRTLILGDEELMYLPQLLASALGGQVRTSTTTRTPAVAIDEAGYPLRTMLTFCSTEDGRRPAYAYNVTASSCREPGNAPGFDDIVLLTDAASAARVSELAGLLAASARTTAHILLLRPAPARVDRRAAQ